MGNDYDGKVIIGTELKTDGVKKNIKALEMEIEELDKKYDEIAAQDTFIGQADQLKKLRERAAEARKELEKLKETEKQTKPKDNIPIPNGDDDMANFDKKMAAVNAKLFATAALMAGFAALAGVALSSIESYLEKHEDTANKFKQVGSAIKNFADGVIEAIGNAMGPYIEKFIDWLLRLLGYINVFVKTISGGKIDLTKKMDRNAKSVEKTSKATKELNNQMAKFDEATKIQDNTKLDNAAQVAPEINFQMPELDPKWVERIEDFARKVGKAFDFIKDHIVEIISVIGAIKIATWLDGMFKLIGTAGVASTGAGGTGLVGLSTALLAIIAALGVLATAKTWQEVIDNYRKLKDELEGRGTEGEKSKEVTEKVGDALLHPENYTPEQVSVAKKANLKQMGNVTQQIKGHSQQLKDWTKGLNIVVAGGDALVSSLKGQTNNIDIENNALSDLSNQLLTYIDTQNKAINAGNLSEEEIAQYVEWLKVQKKELREARDMQNENSRAYKIMDETLAQVSSTIKKYDTATQGVADTFSELKSESDQAKTKIQEMTNQLLHWNNTPVKEKTFKVTLEENLPAAEKVGNRIAQAFGDAMAKLKLQMAFVQGVNNLTMSVQKVFTGLATGGLINLPGRGVPLGQGVVGGERGVEGVIPLTDQAAMETLGETIGRYVTINANITNTMNGRVISRELQKINNENTFMNNR